MVPLCQIPSGTDKGDSCHSLADYFIGDINVDTKLTFYVIPVSIYCTKGKIIIYIFLFTITMWSMEKRLHYNET